MESIVSAGACYSRFHIKRMSRRVQNEPIDQISSIGKGRVRIVDAWWEFRKSTTRLTSKVSPGLGTHISRRPNLRAAGRITPPPIAPANPLPPLQLPRR